MNSWGPPVIWFGHLVNRTSGWLLSLGAAIGIALALSPAGVSLGFAAAVLFAAMVVRFIEEDERGFVLIMLAASMTLRIVLILVSSYYELVTHQKENLLGIGDQEFIVLWGRLFAAYAKGETMPLYNDGPMGYMMHREYYGYSINMRLLGILYYLFGYSPGASKVLNSILASVTAVVFYDIARRYFGRGVARLTLVLVLLWPSLFLWSITNLKEPLRIFLLSSTLWLYLRFCWRPSIVPVLLMGVVFLILPHVLKPSLVNILGASLAVAYALQCGLRRRTKAVVLVVLLLVVAGVGPVRQTVKARVTGGIRELMNYHRGVISTGGQVYRLYDDPALYNRSLPLEAIDLSVGKVLKVLARAWWHFLLEPFIWNPESTREVAAIPQTLVWYLLLPFAGLGMVCAIRSNAAGVWGFPIFLFCFISVVAMAGGNVGTTFRHRDMITPFVLLFGAAGVARLASAALGDRGTEAGR